MSSKPPTGKRMKAQAPSPPQAPQPAPRNIFRTPVPEGGKPATDAKENMFRSSVDLQVTLPQGYQTSVTEDGSKALMDLLVELCSHFRLNPALHTLELFSPEGHNLGFKPNALLGSLNVACVLIKEKVLEEKVARRPTPKVPEKTVRLMINYHGSQKAVVRVNPFVPLQTLLPLICEKCDFDPAHVLLLKDSVSRYELQLDKSLTDLEIKELYVHDQSLVLQPKMASAPALNYSDSICSSTSSLNRTERKSFLGIFHFSKRKSKTQTTAMDTDDYDDKVTQNSDTQPSDLSTMSRVSITEDPPTLGHSQSVMNIPRTPPSAHIKKRRAPALPGAPPVTVGHVNFDSDQTGVGSESQQKKRKAPVPPSTLTSASPGHDNASASVAPAPVSQTTPHPVSITKVVQSSPSSPSVVVPETENPLPLKTAGVAPAVHAATPSSSSKSSSTPDSATSNDSSSELSHCDDTDTDPDPDQTSSQCSSLSNSTVSSSVLVQSTIKISSNQVEESEKSPRISAKSRQETTTASNSRPENEFDLNLKLDEAENRHSAMAWVHSMRKSEASCQKPDTQAPEEETMSFGSSSGGSSLPDQSFAAFEEMADGEDSGMVSSPSDTQPTSPEGSLSLDGCNRAKMLGPVRDNSSDSDEGCATWRSKQRDKDLNPQAVSGRLQGNYKDDPDLTTQLRQTLGDFKEDLKNHVEVVSVSTHTTVTGSNEVPVSVVDMDVPVTAIDEVLEEFDCKITKNEAKLFTGPESAGSNGPSFSHRPSVEPQNKNNNARTAAESNKNSSANVKQLPKTNHSRKPLEKPKADKKEEKFMLRKIKEVCSNETSEVKMDKQKTASSTKLNGDVGKRSTSTEINPGPLHMKTQAFQEKKTVISSIAQRTVLPERHEQVHRDYKTNASSNSSYGKITCNVSSRFGMKTFTVVPPKPAVTQVSTKVPASTLSVGAIKIDDQGNMVKAGIDHNKVGGSLKPSEIDDSEGSLLLGRAKAFWSLSERQEGAVLHNKGLIDKAKETTDGLKSPPPAVSECERNTSSTTDISLRKPTEKFQPKRLVKPEAIEPRKEFTTKVEVENKISASKHTQQVSNKPAVLPYVVADPRKDLSFLKTTRRTSSQYVASALNRYTPIPSTKPNAIPTVSHASTSFNSHNTSLQRSGQPVQGDQNKTTLSFRSDNKENESAFKLNPPGPVKMSSSENLAKPHRDFSELRMNRGEFGSSAASKESDYNTLETGTTKNKHIQSTGTTHVNMAPIGDTDNIKHLQSTQTVENRLQNSAAKSSTAHKFISQGQTSNTVGTTKTNTSLMIHGKAQTPITETDSGVISGALPVSVFGPVKKFRPVVCRSVEKDTSLHSSLMEAIQTSRGKDGLKKIQTPGSGHMKKMQHVEEESERSALLAAIRAQSNFGRLRKTKSEAAEELERFRTASEEGGGAGTRSCPSTPSVTSHPVFSPPPTPLLMPQPSMNTPHLLPLSCCWKNRAVTPL
eukprot:XP_011603749.1 PREDICTED: protein cordon-bleu isoform X3 [Takifugu rubripes]